MEDVVALPEGRQGDRELVQSIVDILAEPAGPHLALERHIGGGDEPHLHRDRLRASERLHLSHLQRTQQLRLGGERKIDDFIEEQRAAPGQLELPLLALMRPGERTLLVRSEEHTSELQSRLHLVCRLLLEKKKKTNRSNSDMSITIV